MNNAGITAGTAPSAVVWVNSPSVCGIATFPCVPFPNLGLGVRENRGFRELLIGECSIVKKKRQSCEGKFSQFDHTGFDQPEFDFTGAGNSSRLGLSFWFCLYNEEHKAHQNVQMLAVATGQCPVLSPHRCPQCPPSCWQIREPKNINETSPEYFQIICVH